MVSLHTSRAFQQTCNNCTENRTLGQAQHPLTHCAVLYPHSLSTSTNLVLLNQLPYSLMSSAPGGGGKGESGFEVAQLRVESAALRGELDDVKRAVRSQRPSAASAPVGTDESSLPPILRMFGKAPPNRPSAVKRNPKPNEGRWGSGPDQFYDGRTRDQACLRTGGVVAAMGDDCNHVFVRAMHGVASHPHADM